jgi:hypothetical protein
VSNVSEAFSVSNFRSQATSEPEIIKKSLEAVSDVASLNKKICIIPLISLSGFKFGRIIEGFSNNNSVRLEMKAAKSQ